MADAAQRIDEIDRAACRRLVVERYSTDALAGRIDVWLDDVVGHHDGRRGDQRGERRLPTH
jgi:hypothetical protein